MSARPVRVLLADDHPIFRDGLRAALESVPDIEVAGEAENGEAALAATATLRPHVVLMDLNMPGMSGVEATRRLTATGDTLVLVLTMHQDHDSLFASLRAGASGYLLKGAGRDEVVRAVLAIADGEAVFGPGIAQRVLTFFATLPNDQTKASRPQLFPELTEREREILDLVAEGLGNQSIARRLHLAPKTIRNSVSTILTKLQATDRGEAIAQARRYGLGQPHSGGDEGNR
jgi:DNA-binding NarL/FixJ family response regulator